MRFGIEGFIGLGLGVTPSRVVCDAVASQADEKGSKASEVAAISKPHKRLTLNLAGLGWAFLLASRSNYSS